MKQKTDNRSLADKQYLRKRLIREAQLEPLRVLDLFSGEGHIWSGLKKQLHVESYTPIDKEHRQDGQIRMKITPRIILALDLSRYNVIDVDTYGDPWTIWTELLPLIRQKTAIFLTRGKVTYGAGKMPISKQMKQKMGIPTDWDVPGKVELLKYGDRCQLLQPCATAKITKGYGIYLLRVDYYALLVEPLDIYGNVVESTVSSQNPTRTILLDGKQTQV